METKHHALKKKKKKVVNEIKQEIKNYLETHDNENRIMEFPSGLGDQIKDSALSLLRCMFSSWPENFCMFLAKPKRKENAMVQNLWDAAKAVLRGKLVAIEAFPSTPPKKNPEKSRKINDLAYHLKI